MGLIFSSYSQHAEDKILDTLTGSKKNGFYVDVGTADPIRFSNTYRFYKKGWKGILIEPNPNRIDKLKIVRPKDIVLNVGASSNNGIMDFYVFNPPNVSTFSEKGKNINLQNWYILDKTVHVSVKPLSQIFEENESFHQNNIDFISVDTEGYDMVVLWSNNWDKYRPHFVIVECVIWDIRDVDRSEFVKYMESKNYKEIFYNNLNIIFKDSMLNS